MSARADWHDAFVQLVRQGFPLREAAAALAVSISTVKNHRINDPDFDQRVKAAMATHARPDRAERRRGPGWTDTRWHEQFLAFYALDPHLGRACEAVGVNRATARRHLNKFPDFGDSYQALRQARPRQT